MFSLRPARRGPERQDGSALITAVFVSFLLGLLGLSFVLMGELEARTVQRHLDRERCRQAALDVAQIATSWWSADATGSPFLPPSEEWSGSLVGWRERRLAHPFEQGLRAEELRGDDGSPDLLLEEGTFLEALADTLGEGLVVERIAISAPPWFGGEPAARASLSVTVSSWRGAMFTGRTTLVANVEDLPTFAGPELLASGGDVFVAPGADLRWGHVRAGGDVRLPGTGRDGHPASGLPRGASGLEPLDYSPGSAEDWQPRHSMRFSVLSELIGYTRGNELVHPHDRKPPDLADPWLSVHAGDALLIGEKGRDWARRPGMRQPRPHDHERPIEEDASHLLQRLGDEAAEPLLAGRIDSVLRGRTGAQGGQQRSQRRFVLTSTGPGGEGLWAENGAGESKPAAAWMADSVGAPFVAVFTAAGAAPPPLVTLSEGAGVVLVEAQELRLRASSGGRLEAVNMPGEPFQDRGIDTDGDGLLEPSTIANGRWDCDCDGDGRPDTEPPRELFFQFVHSDVRNGAFPDDDRDPAYLSTAPHEPFLNLDYPTRSTDTSVRVVYEEAPGYEPRPVADLDGDGRLRKGVDRFTTWARDDVGARLELPLHFRGLVVNTAGSVELGPGYRLHGAVRALGDVNLRAGAGLSFDEALALEGRPSGLGLPEVVLGAHAWSQGAVELAAPAFDRPKADEVPAPVADAGADGEPGSGGNRG